MNKRGERGDLQSPQCERRGSANGVASWLIHRAASTAPEALSSRLEEEWLADLATRTSAWSRLCFGIGCCWATRVICHDHAVSTFVPTPAPTLAAKSVIAYAQHNFGRFSRRTTTLGLVACLHIAVFYAFLLGLPDSLHHVNEPPLQNHPIPDVHPRTVLPVLPPSVGPVKVDVPKLDTNFTTPSYDEEQTVHEVIAAEPPTQNAAPPVPPHIVKELPGGPGSGFPNAEDYYPSLAQHMGEQGVATVRVCVDTHGRLTSDPATIQSTGSPRLDDGALKLARAGSGHYRATTKDGVPVDSCYPLRIRFQLRN